MKYYQVTFKKEMTKDEVAAAIKETFGKGAGFVYSKSDDKVVLVPSAFAVNAHHKSISSIKEITWKEYRKAIDAQVECESFYKQIKSSIKPLIADKELYKKVKAEIKKVLAQKDGWKEDKNAGSWVYDPEDRQEISDTMVLPLVVYEGGYFNYYDGGDYPAGKVDIAEVAAQEEVSEEEAYDLALQYAKDMALEGWGGYPDLEEEDREREKEEEERERDDERLGLFDDYNKIKKD